MRGIYWIFFCACLLLPTVTLADPPESECIPYLNGQLKKMASGAQQCDASAAFMRTFPSSNPPLDQIKCDEQQNPTQLALFGPNVGA